MNEAAPKTRFARDTSVRALDAIGEPGDGVYAGLVDPGWFVRDGPNGGYLAALLVRAMEGCVADPERTARSLTVHYARAPKAGPVRIETSLERKGGALSTVSARLLQDGELMLLALGAFSRERRSAVALSDAVMPEVEPPERCPPLERRIPIHERYEHRWAVGAPPYGGGSQALCGAWIRLVEPQPVDAALAAAYADGLPPALFSSFTDRGELGVVPTLDLTVHFRATLPVEEAPANAWTLAVFRTRVAREGFMEEDGELWSQDGTLLAQSRQLALAR